ncbi:antitoxin VbhA family protein [Thermoflavimicrobium dichotomicum]|uniref:Antitoxin VbhA domain-containing protein n=1 Tax=Thermoflavimicrobium dichotomicum TaxID=46223 RepID=A0A1I3RZI0_9BACL|nr:antitoxin VbhA family protein [Thermoflavimicrobium dichotomicum]SFJ51875.1 hypothetical protein SAMN05421852_111103 [Thermoflavimicrobium dichotomicum]
MAYQKFNEPMLEKIIRQTKATLAIEGLIMTKQDEELIKAKLRGDISREEFLKRALEMTQIG